MLFKHVGKDMLSPEAMQPFHQHYGWLQKGLPLFIQQAKVQVLLKLKL